MIEEEAFERAKEKIIGVERQRLGIGTLSEKTVHAILKNYYEPSLEKQEVPIDRYVADIFTGQEIIEIQTRHFYKLKEKLSCFLPQYPVTIVYPVSREKWIIWIEEETGELSKKRKSPLKGNEYTIFPELYRIKPFLKHPNLRIRLVFLEVEEYKLLNGFGQNKKKGATKFDRIPTKLLGEMEVTCLKDYMQFVPAELEGEFTTKDFAKFAHIPVALAQTVVPILYEVGMITRTGKQGKQYLYEVMEI